MFLQMSVCQRGGGVLHPGGFSIGGGVLHRGGFSIRGGGFSIRGGFLHPEGGFSIRGGSPSGGALHPVNVRAVRILLECILVSFKIAYPDNLIPGPPNPKVQHLAVPESCLIKWNLVFGYINFYKHFQLSVSERTPWLCELRCVKILHI